MQDLKSIMYYKAKFRIQVKEDKTDMLWLLVREIMAWMLSKWNLKDHIIVDPNPRVWTRFKSGGKLYDLERTNKIFAESASFTKPENNKIVWACKIVENPVSEKGNAPREWVTEIGYEEINQKEAEISYVVTYSDMPGYIGLCDDSPIITVPRIIRAILNHNKLTCFIGPNRLRYNPLWLNAGDYPKFEQIVFDKNRTIPVIYISPRGETDEDEGKNMLINPNDLAKCVAANALILCSNDLQFAEEMRWLIDEKYGCYGGAIRVYQQVDMNDSNDSYKHRFLSASFITEHGNECVLEIFRKALAQDVHFYESMFRLDSCQKLIEEAKREQRIVDLKNQSENDIDEATKCYLEESDKRAEAERTAKNYKNELEEEKKSNYNLKIQLDVLKEKAQQMHLAESANEGIRKIRTYPESPKAVAEYFSKAFPDRMVFTERAWKSLDECQTRCDYLWEVLYLMATELYDLIHENSGQAYKEFTARTNWNCSRGVGPMTHEDKGLMKQYYDTYNGQEINIEAHVKNGVKDSDPKSVRIYFAYDPQVADQIIIGHCGKHLDNYGTRKIK